MKRVGSFVRIAGRCFVVVCILGSLACGTDGPTGPTEEFPLPLGAPPDAAAPSGTTSILITAIDMLAQDGTPTAITALQLNGMYRFRLWIFCPRGQDALADVYILGGGGREVLLSVNLASGYNVVQTGLRRYGNSGMIEFVVNLYRVTERGYEDIVSKQFTVTVR